MSNLIKNLTRNQLAEFLPNARAIRAFEQLLAQIAELNPDELIIIKETAQSAALEAALANGSSNEAIAAITRLAKAVEMLASAPPRQNDNSTTTDYIDLRDHGWAPAYRMGRMWFGPTGTLEIGMGNGNITQQVGEEFFRYGKASAAIDDTNLQLVYQTGAVGASSVITFAPTVAGITDADKIIGIATEPIANNDFGRVTTMGIVHGTNTTGSIYGEVWADNDDIWYNPVTGGLTKTKPTAPNIKVMVGTILNAGSGGSGSFSVNIGHSSTLGGTDSNVQFGALSNGDLLQYSSANQRWENVASTAISVNRATNLAGGLEGSTPYQTGANTTSFVSIGTAGQFYRVNAGATAPEWASGAALTKTDDTNVTITLGGSPTAALLAATSLTLGWTGVLSPARGGTGVNNSTRTLTINTNSGTIAFGAASKTLTVNNSLSLSGTDGTTMTFPTTTATIARTDAAQSFTGTQTFSSAFLVTAPAPASIAAAATLTNANIQAQIINTTGTSYTLTMPLGTTLESLVTWPAVDLGYNFNIINTASGTITVAVNTGVTSLGGLTIATGVSASFRIRRTAANTFVLYRLS